MGSMVTVVASASPVCCECFESRMALFGDGDYWYGCSSN